MKLGGVLYYKFELLRTIHTGIGARVGTNKMHALNEIDSKHIESID